MTDTDEVRATCRALTDALYEYLTLPIKSMERGMAMAKAHAAMPGYASPFSPEALIRAQEDLQATRDAMEKTEAAFDGFPEDLREGMLAALRAPFEQQIRTQERYLSDLQRYMEGAQALPDGSSEPARSE